MKGYVLNVKLQKIKTEYNNTELFFERSPFFKGVAVISLACLFILSIAALGSWAGGSKWVDPSPVYSMQNVEPVFTRDHLVGFPQLSPDGKFIAHLLSNKLYEDDYLALTDLTNGETKRLVKMPFDNGFKWNLEGNKIVYQQTTKLGCEMRLLLFDINKQVIGDNFLGDCFNKAVSLSFAWFDEYQFYVNLVARQKPDELTHHLYSFDTRSKEDTLLLTAKAQEGIGFFSLEYDKSTDSLYMLQTDRFVKTDFYRYRDGQLTKLARVDHEVKQFGVANNRLIYEDNRNEFVINTEASDFTSPQVLLPSPMMPIAEPHFNGEKLTFLAGNTFGYAVNKLAGNQSQQIELAGFNPSVFAVYKNDLVFVSNQKGTYQIYQVLPSKEVVQISNIAQNERIKYITVAGNIFAVSFYDKVCFYQYRDGELVLTKVLPGYTNAFLSDDAERVLLSTVASKSATGNIFEVLLSDFQPKPLTIDNAIAAMYYNGDVLYVDKNQRLVRYTAQDRQVLAEHINIRYFVQTYLQEDKLYYIGVAGANTVIEVYDLATGLRSNIKLADDEPTRIAVIGDAVFVRLRKTLKPKLMVGAVVPQPK